LLTVSALSYNHFSKNQIVAAPSLALMQVGSTAMSFGDRCAPPG
jgi:hypothetical protein